MFYQIVSIFSTKENILNGKREEINIKINITRLNNVVFLLKKKRSWEPKTKTRARTTEIFSMAIFLPNKKNRR